MPGIAIDGEKFLRLSACFIIFSRLRSLPHLLKYLLEYFSLREASNVDAIRKITTRNILGEKRTIVFDCSVVLPCRIHGIF